MYLTHNWINQQWSRNVGKFHDSSIFIKYKIRQSIYMSIKNIICNHFNSSIFIKYKTWQNRSWQDTMYLIYNWINQQWSRNVGKLHDSSIFMKYKIRQSIYMSIKNIICNHLLCDQYIRTCIIVAFNHNFKLLNHFWVSLCSFISIKIIEKQTIFFINFINKDDMSHFHVSNNW